MNKKRYYIYSLVLLLGITTLLSSCKKFMDINKNPNAPTGTVEESFLLGKTIVTWARVMPNADNYGCELSGAIVTAGGVSGNGSLIDYNYRPGNYTFW